MISRLLNSASLPDKPAARVRATTNSGSLPPDSRTARMPALARAGGKPLLGTVAARTAPAPELPRSERQTDNSVSWLVKSSSNARAGGPPWGKSMAANASTAGWRSSIGSP